MKHFSIELVLLALVALAGSFVEQVNAQSPFDGFDPNANEAIWAMVVQPDGKILIGGDFTIVQGISRNRIARLNPDGTLDAAFDPNANESVRSIAVQADGKILAGGSFSGAGGIGGQTRNYIARLDPTTGLADPSFNPNADNIVLSIAVQPDGRVVVGGAFTSIGGQMRNCIARLNAATGLADPFNPNANSTVVAIAVVGGKILVGGAFNGANSIGGQTRNFIARLDAATGGVEAWDPNANSSVRSFAVQADGKILVGGDFSGANSVGGQTRNRIARLDAITGLADSFNPNASSQVFAITVQPDGKILAGGSFNSMGGQSRPGIARLNPGGTLDNALNPNPNGQVFAIAVQPDGKILAGGNFTTLAPNGGAGVTRNNIARLETDGWLDRTLDLDTNGAIYAIAVQPDGKIIIGGVFTSVLGVPRSCIARLNTDGTLDMGFDPNSNAQVLAIAVQADGKILVGGFFFSIGGQSRDNIARLNSNGTADSFNPSANGQVMAIAVQPDGKILVGGTFTTIAVQTRNRIARLDPVSGAVDSFDPDANGFVDTIALQSDGKILVGGGFYDGISAPTIGGETRNRIARLDGATGHADSFNPNGDHQVHSILLQNDNTMLVSGYFQSIGGQSRIHCARLDTSTALADSFDPSMGNGSVYSTAVQSDGNILLAGFFQTSGTGPVRVNLARLNPVTAAADSFAPNANGGYYSLAMQADGKLLVSGNFTTINGQTRNLFARLSNDTPALQNVAVTQGAVTWTRQGSSPRLSRVTFESSTDSVNYSLLGNGTPTGANWSLTGLNLPTGQNLYIRARGYYRSGQSNGSESITESVRNVFLSPQPVISGTVTYGNASAPPKYISNVTAAGVGSPNVFTTTAAPGATAGQYSLTGFGSGSYTVSLSKTTGQNSITSNDAARIAQQVAGTVLFTNDNQRVSADVTGNNAISSQDAAKIAQVVAGLPLSAPNFTGTWRFFVPPGPTFPVGASPTSRTYASVTSNLTGEDYIGILIGEVTGNWTPSAARRVRNGQDPAAEGAAPERSVTVQLPSATSSIDNEIVLPVGVQEAANKGVISYEFDLRYDPSVIQPLGDGVDLKETVSRGLSVVTNAEEPGLLRVVVYGAVPIAQDGVLLNLRFTAVGVAGSMSPLVFERFMFNEGDQVVRPSVGQVDLSAAP